MKRIFAFVVVACLGLGACACSSDDGSSASFGASGADISTITCPAVETDSPVATDIASDTGVMSGQIEQPAVYYQGSLYKYNFGGFFTILANRYVPIGEILEVDLTHMPDSDFFATGVDLQAGQGVYADSVSSPSVLFVDVGEVYMPLYPTDQVSPFFADDYYINICQNYWLEESPDTAGTITNWDDPVVERNIVLPDLYYEMADEIVNRSELGEVIMVRFTTTSDPLLGPIDMYLSDDGVIVGMGYRE